MARCPFEDGTSGFEDDVHLVLCIPSRAWLMDPEWRWLWRIFEQPFVRSEGWLKGDKILPIIYYCDQQSIISGMFTSRAYNRVLKFVQIGSLWLISSYFEVLNAKWWWTRPTKAITSITSIFSELNRSTRSASLIMETSFVIEPR